MICLRPNCTNEAVKDPMFGIMPCKSCQASDSPLGKRAEFDSLSKHNRITAQRDTNSKDTIQPYDNLAKGTPNPEFVKAYPELAPQYFNHDQLSKL